MTEAIFGLVGVIVGAGISGAVTYGLEWRRDGQRVRAAARLLEQELEPFVGGLYQLGDSVRRGDETAFRRRAGHVGDFTLDLWKEHRQILAATLDIGAWYSVMYAYLALGRLKRELDGASLPPADAAGDLADRVKSAESAVYGAVDTLGKRAGRDEAGDEVTVLRGSRW